ncbi:MAG TPA: Gfo/Idh/MocA family oxidoreductase [Verrucomicrobiae bacterium]|nr:Gfo/Idh/MocA family oxidoreductase [Verrucomicrobiae bacterium]
MNPIQPASRRTFLKTVGTALCAAPFVTSGLLARSPNSVLRHASFGGGGMAFGDLTVIGNWKGVELAAICDVDSHRAAEARERFPNARFYRDWRELLEKEGGQLDSVNVSTPDHMHAAIAVTAMRMGKHVYCQKPLAHDLYEVRRMTEIAAEQKVVTQMGIQIHSAAPYRTGVRILRDRVIGKVREIHSWCPKSWGDTAPLPRRSDPIPPGLDWDLWLGVCHHRPYIGSEYYHPFNWRKRLDFGTGTLGDMGCHLFDPLFTALELKAPIAIRSEGAGPNKWNWPLNGKVIFQFDGTSYTAADVLPVTWYDGEAKLPAGVVALLEGHEVPETGSVIIGTEGVLLLPHFSRPSLFPQARFKEYELPELGDLNHWGEFVKACMGEGKTSTDFSYSGPLTETILAGCVASRFPQTDLKWNSEKLRFNLRDANKLVRRRYRRGWRVEGLS